MLRGIISQVIFALETNQVARSLGRVGCAGVLLAVLAASTFATEVVHFASVTNTEVASFGVGGMRDAGSATITVSNIPAGATIKLAYLYWHGPTNSTDPTVNASMTVNGTTFTGTNIGFSADDNWGFTNSQAYRAEVTSVVTGNGSYVLTGFKADPSTTPAGVNTNAANTNGASLIIFYDDHTPANYRDVLILNGNDSNEGAAANSQQPNPFDPNGWTATASGINWPGGNATADLQFHVSDGQIFTDDEMLMNGQPFVAAGNIFQGDSVPAANNGPTGNGNLWDIKDFNVTSFLTPGNNTLTLTTVFNSLDDYISLIAAVYNLPTGSLAPSQTAQSQPTGADTTNTFTFVGTDGNLVQHILSFPHDAAVPTGIDPTTLMIQSVNNVISNGAGSGATWPQYVVGGPFAPSHLFVKAGDNRVGGGTDFGSLYSDLCSDATHPPADENCPTSQKGILVEDIFDPDNKPTIATGTTAAMVHFVPSTENSTWIATSTNVNPVCTETRGKAGDPVPQLPQHCDTSDGPQFQLAGDQTSSGTLPHRKGMFATVYNVPMLESQVSACPQPGPCVSGTPINTPGVQGSSTTWFNTGSLNLDFKVNPGGCNPSCPTPSVANNYFHPAPVASETYGIDGPLTTSADPAPDTSTVHQADFSQNATPTLGEGVHTIEWEAIDNVGIQEQNVQLLTSEPPGGCPNPYNLDPAPTPPCYSTTFFSAQIGVDTTAPTVSALTLNPAPVNGTYAPNTVVTASTTCVDPISNNVASGVVTCGSNAYTAMPTPTAASQSPVNGASSVTIQSSQGSQTITLSAKDQAGNVGSNSVTVCSGYAIVSVDRNGLSGFTAPVDNPGPGPNYVVNKASTKSAVPLQLTVNDCHGSPVTNLDVVGGTGVGSVKTVQLSVANAPQSYCSNAVLDNSIPPAVASSGGSGWQNFLNGTYQFNWKSGAPVNSCLAFTMNLGDNIPHVAYFQIIK